VAAAVAGLAAPAGPVVLLLGIAGCQLLGLIVTAVVARVTFRGRTPGSIVSQANNTSREALLDPTRAQGVHRSRCP
jgi:hypothetical protein